MSKAHRVEGISPNNSIWGRTCTTSARWLPITNVNTINFNSNLKPCKSQNKSETQHHHHQRFLCSCMSTTNTNHMPSNSTSHPVRIAIVGDVHDDWELECDSIALQFLHPHLVLFTGDFGNENVELVTSIAQLEMRKAAILGNHDTWFTHQFSSSPKVKDGVQLQLQCLGNEHVGYKRLDFPDLKLSVVGGRPFSNGGNQLYKKKLLSARYGVSTLEESAKKIHKAAAGTPEEHCVIFLAHNGPTGLGSRKDDICGKDWVYGGGDHGDPDLGRAISLLKESSNFVIPLVVFGHMHKALACGGLRKMIAVDTGNTIYLNGAVVPRVRYPGSGGSIRMFTVVELLGGEISKVAETWVSVIGDTATVAEEHILFSSSCTSERQMSRSVL